MFEMGCAVDEVEQHAPEYYISANLHRLNPREVSRRPNLSLKFIEDHTEVLSFFLISEHNVNLTIDFLHKHRWQRWSWIILTTRDIFSIEDIRRETGLPWRMSVIHLNPNFTAEMILNHAGLPHDIIPPNAYAALRKRFAWLCFDATSIHEVQHIYKIISNDACVTQELIDANSDYPWLS